MENPWQEIIDFHGTDSTQNKPNFNRDTDNVSVYLTDITRSGNLSYTRTTDMFGMDVYDVRLSPDMLGAQGDFPTNEKFYQLYGGFLNLSYQGAPLFISKNHFYDAPSNWS